MSNGDKPDAFPWEPSSSKIPKVAAKMPVDRYDFEYKMTHKKRGFAYIFCNEYTNEIYQLPSKDYKKDSEALSATLRDLKFTVTCFENLTVAEIDTELDNLTAMNHDDCDCVLIAILSLGDNGLLYGRDKYFKLDTVLEKFAADLVLSLAGKPKIFIIEANRGSKLDYCVPVYKKKRIESDYYNIQNTDFFTLPKFADFLIAHSTLPEYHSFVNRTTGSPFIQSLCSELNENRNNYHLLILLTFVCQKVAFSFNDSNRKIQLKQTPCTTSTLTRLIKFT